MKQVTELKGWKAKLVLAASWIIIINAVLTIPIFVALGVAARMH